MNRSRFQQSGTFTRRDVYAGTAARQESKTVELFYKLRQFRPYLQGRLKKIYADHNERKFVAEVDDIKYLLSVMSDMAADENHGAGALQEFIDRIHEMVRKNPLNEEIEVSDDDEAPSAPRSPSPADEVIPLNIPTRAPPAHIPLERDDRRSPERSFDYFNAIEQSIENSIHDRNKESAQLDKNPWDPGFSSHGPVPSRLDIDMRNVWNNDGGSYRYTSNDRPAFSRDYHHTSRQFDRNSSFRDSNYERPREPSRPPDEPPMFERRQQTSFDRRRDPSFVNEGSLHIDYNHGAEDQWERRSSGSRNIRFSQQPIPPMQGFPIPGSMPTNFDPQPQPPIFRSQSINFGMNPYIRNTGMMQPLVGDSLISGSMGNMRNMNIPRPVVATPIRPRVPPQPPGLSPGGINWPVNPAAGSANSFNGPENSSNFPTAATMRNNLASTIPDTMKEMFNRKAQEIFGRSHSKRDNQNVPPTTTNTSQKGHASLRPPDVMLSSNQMISDRDPRTKKPNDPRLAKSAINRPVAPAGSANSFNGPENSSSVSVAATIRKNHASTIPKPTKETFSRKSQETAGSSHYKRDNQNVPPTSPNASQKAHTSQKSQEPMLSSNQMMSDRDPRTKKPIDPRLSKSGNNSNFSVAATIRKNHASAIPETTKETFSRKSQETSGSSHHKRDNQNVPPTSSNASKKAHTSQKSQEPMLSSNQMISDRDPRTKKPNDPRINKKNQKTSHMNASSQRDAVIPQSKSNKKGRKKSTPQTSKPETTKKPVFRIPKIKKPDPPPKSPTPEPPPKSLTPEPPSSVSPDRREPADEPNPAVLSDDFIKKFLMAEMNIKESSVLQNPASYDLIRQQLNKQIRQIFTNHDEVLPSTSGQKESTMNNAGIEDGESSVESAGHRSRSTTKQRNSKRRSSLDKLHDALKEMRFDAMLPLGPRRCTLGPDSEVSSEIGTPDESKDSSQKSSNTPLAATKKRSSRASGDAAINIERVEAEENQPPVSAGSKRGQKRKRKRSAAKTVKKRKSTVPVNRAQAAIKSALKAQQKERKRKPADPNRSTDGARITRSMRNSRNNMSIPYKVRVKSEPVDVKQEPEDQEQNFEASIDLDNTGLLFPSIEDIDAQLASINMDLLTGTFDENDSDVELDMSIDIKSEPDSDQEHVERADTNSKDTDISADVSQVVVVDTDYSTDVTEFLPDVPTIDAVYSVGEPSTSTTMDLIINQLENQNKAKQVSDSDSDSFDYLGLEIKRECYDVIDDLIDIVEREEVFRDNYSVENETLNEYSRNVDMKPFIPLSESDDEEPNDFFAIINSDDEEPAPLLVSTPDNVEPNSSQTASSSIEPEVSMQTQCLFPNVSQINIKQEITENAIPVLEVDPVHQQILEKIDNPDMLSKMAYDVEPVLISSLPTSDPTITDPEAQPGSVTNLIGRNLYKCSNKGCTFDGCTSTEYKNHILLCEFSSDTKSFGCPHCDKRVKAVVNLMEHLKTHGRQKQSCAICSYKTWATSELTRHMKSYHKVYNHKIEKLDGKTEDDDPEYVLFPKDCAARVSTVKQLKDCYARYADRLVFTPDDADKVPNRQIFHTLAYCSECTYSSKVRINFVRHLESHKLALENPNVIIPSSDPVNPVPCLDRKELMFDKMTNWAGSSHENKQENSIAEEGSPVPQFVSEQFRYICCVEGCAHMTVDEYLLRTHVRTLHPEVEDYNCPHCDKQERTRNDPRNTVPIEKLGMHLKLHGPKLYRCAYCDVVHTQVILMEKHLPEKHPQRKPIHYMVRNLDSDGNPPNRRNSNDDNTPSDKWRCTLCTSKQLFTRYQDIKSHCSVTHRVTSQFICYNCKYNSDSFDAIIGHMQHCVSVEYEPAILIMWYRNEFDSKPEDIVHVPLWRRSNNIKHIRGIFLDESKEKVTKEKQDNSNIKSMTQQPNTDGIFKNSPSVPGPAPKKPKTCNTTKPTNSGEKVSSLKSQSTNIPTLYTCPKCSLFKTKNETSMRVHLYNEMGYQRYRCTTCSVKFITESSLKGHIIGDHGGEFVEAAYESLPTDTEIETYVNKFLTSQDSDSQDSGTSSQNMSLDSYLGTPIQMFTCKHCGQQCQSAHNLKTHLLAKHLAPDRYVCGHCNSEFWNEVLVRNHSIRCHSDLAMVMIEKPGYDGRFTPQFWESEYDIPIKKRKTISWVKVMVYQCPECDYNCDDRDKLVREHLNEHIHTYICPDIKCRMSFRSYLDTKFHIRHRHAEPQQTPLINRNMVKARETLEENITQVQVRRRKCPSAAVAPLRSTISDYSPSLFNIINPPQI